MTRFDIVIFEGVDELDFVAPLEILRAATDAGADAQVRVCAHDLEPITASFGLRVLPDAVFTAGESDVVIVPGGRWTSRAEHGAWGVAQRGEWSEDLREASRRGATMVSVCTGAMILAHAGLIGDRRCTTHHAAREDLAAMGATVIDARVVDDGDLITGAGVTSGLDIGLHLVRRYFGEDAAAEASRRSEYP